MIYAPSGDAPASLTPVATLREAAALRVYKSAAVATTRFVPAQRAALGTREGALAHQ